MATTQEDVTRCDICDKKKDVRNLSVVVQDTANENDIAEALGPLDFCKPCEKRLRKFIERGMTSFKELRKAKAA